MSGYFYTKIETLGNKILLKGYENGKQFRRKVQFSPTIYLPSTNSESEYRSLDGLPLEPYQAGDIKETKDFIDRYRKVDNFSIYGMPNWIYNFSNDEFVGEIAYDETLIRIVYLDIEVSSKGGYPSLSLADKEVTAISIKVKDRVFAWGYHPFEAPSHVTYYRMSDETQLLKSFVLLWERLSVDIVTGWHTSGFDIPYLVRRIRNILGEEWAKRLSPWGFIKSRRYVDFRGNEIEAYDIFGINDIDYLSVYKKFGYISPPDWKLDTIAHLVLKERKLDYKEYGSLQNLYEQNPQKFLEYNIRDTELVERIEKEKNLLRLVINMAYSAKVNFNDVFHQTRIWDSILFGFLRDRKIIIPAKIASDDSHREIEGGYVKEVPPSSYEWVVSFDLTSLYPSLFMHYNIGIDTYRGKLDDITLEKLVDGAPHGYEDWLKENNYSLTANGTYYSRDQKSFMSEIIQTYFDKRKLFKDLMLDTKSAYEKEKDKEKKEQLKTQAGIYDIYQQNFKIGINAVYGATANEGFRHYNLDIAEAITDSGRLTTKWVERRLNRYLNQLLGTNSIDYIIACDTDSIYINFGPLVKKYNVPKEKAVSFLHTICEEKIQPQLNAYFKDLSRYMNSYEQKLFMKREKIADFGIWTAKKRYILNVWSSEKVFYEKPKIEVTGIETVRSTTPEFCREKLKECFSLVIGNDESAVHSYVSKTYEEFLKQPFEMIAKPTGVKGLLEYGDERTVYKRGKNSNGKKISVPIHVRAALLYNHWIKKTGFNTELESIIEGDKIRFCYLTLPNPLHENVIASTGALPERLGLTKYIDYETQWNKTFIEPLNAVLRARGWSSEKISTVEDIFE